jgi:hypothetical protein
MNHVLYVIFSAVNIYANFISNNLKSYSSISQVLFQPVYVFLFHVDFILEDIMVSRSLRQTVDPMNPELPDTPVIGALSKLTQSSLHVPVNKELSVPTASGATQIT